MRIGSSCPDFTDLAAQNQSRQGGTKVTKQDYLQAIKETEEKIWRSYEASYESWQESDPSTRPQNPPKPYIYWARSDGLLYAVTGDKKYAERARRILLEAEQSDIYYVTMVIDQIRDSAVMKDEDLREIERRIVEYAQWAVNYWTEWGAMNHCSNHIVNALKAAVDYLPDHPDVETSQQKIDINLSGKSGKSSIEDSQNYIPIWLKP